ncbi:hypothetical protein A3L04_05300 [Thermococcus chitonophagus]|uniref:Uncharacterized protein n=1 Tax=Thermococcus chitonophagus TaxID=54262 RepID=A0A2Z2N3W5_9EURY|nr:hypothetical protein [Thermococcus chitonophagus]ASJ16531.1 hypothetical protein A3L04_05300 [Thermococcus chitonophagus]
MNPNIKIKILFILSVVLLGTMLAQISVIGLSLLTIAKGIQVPYLLERVSNDEGIIFRATPLLIVLSYLFAAVLARYGILTAIGKAKNPELRVVQVIVLILAISVIVLIFGSIVACGVVCPRLACHGAMESCSWNTGLFYVKYVCRCIVG